MRFRPGNAQHIGARSSQQDAFGFTDPNDAEFTEHAGFLAVVCDGMGGMNHGDAASRMAVRGLLDAYRQKAPEESIPSALERSVRAANDQVVALAHSLGMVEGIGTTLVAAVFKDSSMYYVSVGDSGLFHACYGQLQLVNRFHVFANMLDDAVARGQMSRDAALTHPERDSLTSYIGAEILEEIDRNLDPWPLQHGDTVLLASDGLFKTLARDEVLACMNGHAPHWPDALVERVLAKKREFQDNVTVLSVTLESENPVEASPRTFIIAPAETGVPDYAFGSQPAEENPDITQIVRAMGPPPSEWPLVPEPPPGLPLPLMDASLVEPAYAPPPAPVWSAPAPVAEPPASGSTRWVILASVAVVVLAAAWWYLR